MTIHFSVTRFCARLFLFRRAINDSLKINHNNNNNNVINLQELLMPFRGRSPTSSRISLFLCRRMGSSFINLTMLSYPPISRTFDDFSRTDFGTCPPDRSSIAAGRLSDARTLHKRHAHTHSTFSLSLQQMYFPPLPRVVS